MHRYLENGMIYDQLLLMNNRKLHMCFQLASRSMTLDDLEETAISSKFLGILCYFACLGGNNG